MSPKILQKILEELNKEKPSIDYMKGMVETLMEMSGASPVIKTLYETTNSEVKGTISRIPSDEPAEEVPAFLRPGPITQL